MPGMQGWSLERVLSTIAVSSQTWGQEHMVLRREEVMLEQSPLTGLGCVLISNPSSRFKAEPCMDISCHPLAPAELTFQSQVPVR